MPPRMRPTGQRRVVIVFSNEWEGIYVEGQLVAEGPCLDPETVLRAVGIMAETAEADEEWFENEQNRAFPLTLGEVRWQSRNPEYR